MRDHHMMKGWSFVGIVDLNEVVLLLFWLALLVVTLRNKRNDYLWLKWLMILWLLRLFL